MTLAIISSEKFYFSFVKSKAVKAWKLHRQMTLNLIVPIGNVRFVFINPNHPDQSRIIEIGENNYSRITVPPKSGLAFRDYQTDKTWLLTLQISKHNSIESEKRQMDYFNYKWTIE